MTAHETDALLPAFARTTAKLVEDEVTTNQVVANYQNTYGLDNMEVDALWSCFFTIMHLHRIGDIDENELLSFEEVVGVFRRDRMYTATQEARNLFVTLGKPNHGADELSYRELIESETFIVRHCGL